MSTLDVTCSRCEKKFRVRAEFAGKSTRCPGCSAPITIGGSILATAPRVEPEEHPRPRPRRRDEDDDEPRRSAGDWTPVDMAFRREQVAVVFVFIGIVCDFFAYCLTASMGQAAANMEGFAIAVLLILVIGPALASGAFGIMARISAVKAPPESHARGSAVASLLCGLAGLACLVVMAFAYLVTIDARQGGSGFPMVIAVAGVVVATLAATITFAAFVAQVGIARRSASVSEGVRRTSVAIAVCTLSVLGIAILYTLLNELTTPSYYGPGYGPGGYSRHDDHEVFGRIMLFFFFPLALGVILVMYHRLLAAGRRALQGELTARYDG